MRHLGHSLTGFTGSAASAAVMVAIASVPKNPRTCRITLHPAGSAEGLSPLGCHKGKLAYESLHLLTLFWSEGLIVQRAAFLSK
jgi:hypothetical protein